MKTLNTLEKKMMALVAHAPYDYRYEEVDIPKIREDEALLKVLASGICASDIKCLHGNSVYWGDEIHSSWIKTPVNIGHEFYGQIVAIGDIASKRWCLSVGDLCVPEQIIPCGECRFCKDGNRWMCEVHNMYGFQKDIAEGGMAEYVRLSSKSNVYKLPADMPLKAGGLIEPAGCAVHAVERGNISFNDVVVVSGLGPIGLMMMQMAKQKSPKMVIAIDGIPKRLQLAKKLGADVVIDYTKQNTVDEIRALTNGYGCDVFIESSGNPNAVRDGISMIRKLGRYVQFAVYGKDACIDWSIIGDRKELDIYGAHIGGLDGYPVAIDSLYKKVIDYDEIATHVFPLSEWEKAFQVSEAGKESIKVLLVPDKNNLNI